MAKSYKLKDDNYIDSANVINGRTPLNTEITNMKNNVNVRVRGYTLGWGTSFTFPLRSGEIALVILNATNMLLVWHGGSNPLTGYNSNIIIKLNENLNPTVVGGNDEVTVNCSGNATCKAFVF